MVWHYHDDDVPGPDADVHLDIAGLPADVARRASHALSHRRHAQQRVRRVEAHGLADRAERKQYEQLEAAGQLGTIDAPPAVRIDRGKASLSFSLPRQAVSLVVIEW